ncbi:hypothetical protein GLX30_31600 [Streptomyces sp. Tu 2975]|nr:hypothetical protein GLX30_31600 [Streptomyces sp. Tu 2975]
MHNRYDDPRYADVVRELTGRLTALQAHYGDTPDGHLPPAPHREGLPR